MNPMKGETKMTRPLCIYHGNCADGFTAAWVVRKFFDGDVDFHAGVYQDAPPDVAGRDVILVDFSYKAATLIDMSMRARTILILDHHKSAADDLKDLPLPVSTGTTGPAPADIGFCDVTSGYDPGSMYECARLCNGPPVYALFDMNRSGAGIAWDFFFPGLPRPRLIYTVEDRDLWRFQFPSTRQAHAAIFSHPYDFDLWDALAAQAEDHLETLVLEGVAIERKHFKDIREFIGVARRRMTIGGHDVPVLNAPYFWSSDAGHIMAQGEPFAACYWDTPDGRVFSLRSADNGLDVSEIAKGYGGGGHPHASGFRVPFGHPLAS